MFFLKFSFNSEISKKNNSTLFESMEQVEYTTLTETGKEKVMRIKGKKREQIKSYENKSKRKEWLKKKRKKEKAN